MTHAPTFAARNSQMTCCTKRSLIGLPLTRMRRGGTSSPVVAAMTAIVCGWRATNVGGQVHHRSFGIKDLSSERIVAHLPGQPGGDPVPVQPLRCAQRGDHELDRPLDIPGELEALRRR